MTSGMETAVSNIQTVIFTFVGVLVFLNILGFALIKTTHVIPQKYKRDSLKFFWVLSLLVSAFIAWRTLLVIAA